MYHPLKEAIMKKQPTPQDEVMYVFRPYITLKNGRKLYASAYGKRAWKIPVK